jgi:hypothetical protein
MVIINKIKSFCQNKNKKLIVKKKKVGYSCKFATVDFIIFARLEWIGMCTFSPTPSLMSCHAIGIF